MTSSRRHFLDVARLALVGAAGGLLAPPDRTARAGGPASKHPLIRPARACVLVFMHGGASHIDTFDPKPESRDGGPFRPIATALDGVRVSEHLRGIAGRLGRFAMVRSLTATEGNHDRARYLMRTGFPRQGGVEHPGFGSHVARGYGGTLPGYVSIDGVGQPPGYLGASLAAFSVVNAERSVRNLAPPSSVDDERFGRRAQLRAGLDARFAMDHHGPQVDGLRAIGRRAVEMHGAPDVAAFDLERESVATRERYGDDRFGRACLMARRLVDVGVPFVEVTSRGWDTHADAFPIIERGSRSLDRGVSALVDDLVASGRFADTVVLVVGDFGRTPRINARGGRDHHPAASSMLIGGGPIVRGAVIGETDVIGDRVVRDPVSVPDLYASLAAALGVAPDEMHMTPRGRPVQTVDAEGAVVPSLFA